MSTGRSRRRLTESDAVPRVCLSAWGFRVPGAESDSALDSDANDPHSRDVSVLLSLQRHAGVLFGIDSEAISAVRRSTRPTARWVFSFVAHHRFLLSFEGTGGEVANARVCKTCIRGFDSRPVLQQFPTSPITKAKPTQA